MLEFKLMHVSIKAPEVGHPPAWHIDGIPIVPILDGTPGADVIFNHDGVIKWKPFPRYWLFVRGIHRSMVNPPHKGQ